MFFVPFDLCSLSELSVIRTPKMQAHGDRGHNLVASGRVVIMWKYGESVLRSRFHPRKHKPLARPAAAAVSY